MSVCWAAGQAEFVYIILYYIILYPFEYSEKCPRNPRGRSALTALRPRQNSARTALRTALERSDVKFSHFLRAFWLFGRSLGRSFWAHSGVVFERSGSIFEADTHVFRWSCVRARVRSEHAPIAQKPRKNLGFCYIGALARHDVISAKSFKNASARVSIGFFASLARKTRPERSPRRPESAPVAPRARQDGLRVRQDRPRARQDRPRARHDRPRARQVRPSARHNRPKSDFQRFFVDFGLLARSRNVPEAILARFSWRVFRSFARASVSAFGRLFVRSFAPSRRSLARSFVFCPFDQSIWS